MTSGSVFAWYASVLLLLRERRSRILKSILVLLSGVQPRRMEKCAQTMLQLLS